MMPSPVKAPCRVTQRFGKNPDVYKRFGLKGHNGIDFTGPSAGRKVHVFCPYDAEVIEVGDQGNDGYGRFVRVRTQADDRDRNRELVFGHLDSIVVKKGQWIPLGDQIGVMGDTGFSSNVHLHLGLRYIDAKGQVIDYDNGYLGYVDFEPYLRFWVDKPQTDALVKYPYG